MFDNIPNLSDVEKQSEALDLLMELMLTLETDPCRKAKMQVSKQCKKLSLKFVEIAKEYGDGSNEGITEADAKDMLEYLLCVEYGIDNYRDSHRGGANEN